MIDFGLSVKIPNDKLENIKTFMEEGEFLAALRELCSIPRKDKERIDRNEWRNHYGWACNFSGPDNYYYTLLDNNVEKLFIARETAKTMLRNKFNETHPHGPTLPLKTESSKIAVKENNFIEPPKKIEEEKEEEPRSAWERPAIMDAKITKSLKRVKPKYEPKSPADDDDDDVDSSSEEYGEITSSMY